MNIAAQVREIYEQRPYPFGGRRSRRQPWILNLDWVDAFGRDAGAVKPARVLVAGCGDGTEALQFQRLLPEAMIVAVDFSARSIALARRRQRSERDMQRIRFLVADIADPSLARTLGETFNLIACHGVLSYVASPVQVFRNFARCLEGRGVLYLGVNGSRHVSTVFRRALPALGIGLDRFVASKRVSDALRLCDAVISRDGFPRVSGLGPTFLAGDVFGPLNRCLSLTEWTLFARRAGLHFRGSGSSVRLFRQAAESGLQGVLMPRSRGEVCDLLERLSPSQFHRLLFSRAPEENPPWENRRSLLRWRIELSRLNSIMLPRPPKRIRDRLRPVTIVSSAASLSSEWQMPEWEVELLRRGHSMRSVGSILDAIPLLVPFAVLRRQLFLLHQKGVLRLRPPAGPA